MSVYKGEKEIGNTITNKTFTFDSVGGEHSIRLSIDEFTNASNGATLKVMLNEGTEAKDFATTAFTPKYSGTSAACSLEEP